MMKIYMAGFILAFILSAYFAGQKVGREKCRADFAERETGDVLNAQTKIINTKEKINEEDYNNDIVYVRDWLRKKYTAK